MKKKEILELDAKLLSQIDKSTGDLKTVQLEQLRLQTEGYDVMQASTQKFIVDLFQSIRETKGNTELKNLLGDIIQIPDDATMGEIFRKYNDFMDKINSLEYKPSAGVGMSGEHITGVAIYSREDYDDIQEQMEALFGDGGVLSEMLKKNEKNVGSWSDKTKASYLKAFDVSLDFKEGGVMKKTFTTLVPIIKVIEGAGFDAIEPWEGLPKTLKQITKEYDALSKELNKVVAEGQVDDTPVRTDVRKAYLAELETFREMETRDLQDDQLEKIEILKRNAELTAEYYNIMAEEGKVEADDFLFALADKGDGVKEFMEKFDNLRKDMKENPVKLEQSILIEVEELERHYQNLKNNIKKNEDSITKGQDDNFKYRLQKTKDFYDKMLKLQSKMFEDDISKRRVQNDLTLRMEQKKLNDELALNETNLAEIKKIQDRMVSGKEAGKFIKANKKNFDVLKTMSLDVLKALEDGQKEVIDSITGEKITLVGVMDQMIDEEQRKQSNNKHFLRLLEFQHQAEISRIKQQAIEQQLMLEQKLISQTNALRLTSNDYFSGNYAIFKRQAEEFYFTENRLIRQNSELMKNTRRDQEMNVLTIDLLDAMPKDEWDSFMTEIEGMQTELLVNGEVVMENGTAVMVADTQRQLAHARTIHSQTEGVYGDTEKIKQNTDDAIKHIDDTTKSELLTSEQNFQTTKGDLMANEIQMYAGLYNQMFSMFDTYLQNVEERERRL